MKNIGIISFLFSLLFIVSCEEEYAEYDAIDELSDVSWYLSKDPYSQNPFNVSTETFMSFLDLSQGATNHEWIIEEGNFFLKEGFQTNDSLDLFIDESAGLTITTPKAHVLFKNIGPNNITLRNEFSEPVSFNSKDGVIESVQVGDVWVMEKTFTFEVFGELLPAFKVLQDGNELINVTKDDIISADDSASWPTVQVEAGASLTFVDLTTEDRPNGRSWSITEGAPSGSNSETAEIKFFKLGTAPAGTFKSLRGVLDGVAYPSANAEKIIPLMVEVIPSSQPFELNGQIKEDDSEVISFQVTGEVAQFAGEEANFTVNVTNSAAGFDQNIPVRSARVSSTNSTRIELTLDQPIYNSDAITISYSGGNIKSTDTRDLLDFSDKTVIPYFSNNILTANSWSSYETANEAANRGYLGPNGAFWVGANGTAADPNWSRSLEQKFDGEASAKFSVDGISKAFQLHHYGLGLLDPVPAGTYKVSIMVNVASGTTLDKFRMWGGEVKELGPLSWDLTDVARDEWVKIEHVVTLAAISSKKKLSFNVNPGDNPNATTGRQTFYFDNFSLIPVEVRP
jgi:hypothetical protein